MRDLHEERKRIEERMMRSAEEHREAREEWYEINAQIHGLASDNTVQLTLLDQNE